jgi:hypothetical protein
MARTINQDMNLRIYTLQNTHAEFMTMTIKKNITTMTIKRESLMPKPSLTNKYNIIRKIRAWQLAHAEFMSMYHHLLNLQPQYTTEVHPIMMHFNLPEVYESPILK